MGWWKNAIHLLHTVVSITGLKSCFHRGSCCYPYFMNEEADIGVRQSSDSYSETAAKLPLKSASPKLSIHTES